MKKTHNAQDRYNLDGGDSNQSDNAGGQQFERSKTSRNQNSAFKKQGTNLVQETAKNRLSLSFNSSDIEAYANEAPLPIVKQAFIKYQRNKMKAILRRRMNTIENID